MEVGTTLSKTLHTATARSHADYDAACKRLLSEKVILAWIMKNCLKEYRNCSIQEIMDNYIEGEPQIAKVPVTPAETNIVTNSMIKGLSTEDKTITEGTVTYDIRFLATAPKSKDFIRLILNIEALVTNSMIKGLSTEDKTITEGTVTYDIRFLATAPKSKDFIRLILNIEAQKV